MKKLKHKINEAIAAWHMKWVMSNLPYVTLELHENLVFQLWAAKVKFEHINKWLRWRKLDPIVCYVVNGPGELRYFTAEPSAEVKAGIRASGKQLVHVC